MLKLKKAIDKVCTACAAVLLGAMVVILGYNVMARFLGGGIQWYMESAQYLTVWAMFIVGVALCVSQEHLRIDMPKVTGWLKTVNITLLCVAEAGFYLLLGYAMYLLASKSKQVISTMQPLKMAYVYWPLAIFSFLSAFSAVLGTIVKYRYPTPPTEEECINIDNAEQYLKELGESKL
ncbi:MAG: TRAP transporter small permease subunit [Candidatus Pelethousia sp.]|nr:TRAP transporter small permease subunit [Candidatus Pelethousia sp.]